MDDITPDTLAALVAGDLSDDAARAIRDRLDADPQARERVEILKQLAAFLKEESTIEVSDAAVRQAQRLLAASRPGLVDRLAEKATNGVRTFLAALDFDSRLTPAVAGFRGVADITQVAFSAEVCQIDLEISPDDAGRSAVRGQIDADETGDESAPWTIAFTETDGRTVATADAGPDGTFRVTLPDGSFTMVCERGGVRIEAGPLNIP